MTAVIKAGTERSEMTELMFVRRCSGQTTLRVVRGRNIRVEIMMGQVIQLDATTLLIKSDDENDLAEIIDFVSKKDKSNAVQSFLEFASQNRILSRDFQFHREDCYDK